MRKISILFVFVILYSSCNKPMVLDISVKNFLEGYEKINPGSLEATTILIRNDKTTVYPPFNQMPPDATYYTIPSSIRFYKNIENLHLVGLFVKELPYELEGLPNLENISFSIGDASSVSQIIDVLKSCKKLKALHLMTAIMTNAQLNNLKRGLPHVNVSIQP
ncbi:MULTISPECIES: hypothetical protein [unclassified Pedobacter]|uniref:hypothetical protein n=1 Tax=unclassified Pedobacter TaxID=2628915 RepID=UPI00141E949A|nr:MULTISPECIES: hypothetical protein [unclassified Pedobacter]NII83866.1 hypothetical protein [Pedobacter sp. SG908]NMN37740.1 hypothetical protein [Pedobacter sp. SG918]